MKGQGLKAGNINLPASHKNIFDNLVVCKERVHKVEIV